jgi:hypothetical protein
MLIKKLGVSVTFLVFALLLINLANAYSVKINVCNSTLNTSCLEITSVSAITTAPYSYIYLGPDGNIYLTNDTSFNYVNATNITYIMNYNNVTNFYNMSNGSDLIVVQNFTANDSLIEAWLLQTNLSKYFYNRTFADSIFALKGDYATKTELNSIDVKYAAAITTNFITTNGTTINSTVVADYVINDKDDFTMVWKIILISSFVLTLLLFVMIIRMTVSP